MTAQEPRGLAANAPSTWHYGLVARWWAEFNRASPEEIAFFTAAINRFGSPALDLACGTGRILLPLREAGLEVDGADVSPDMLSYCRELAASSGVHINLYAQGADDLALPRKYRTIFICDSFGIVAGAETIRRCFLHLEPGGALIFNHYLPYRDSERWPLWPSGTRGALPAPWPESGDRKRTANGDEIELRGRLVELDPLEQYCTRQIRARLWRDGKVVEEEEHTLREFLYFRNEVLVMLARAGFGEATVHAGYSDRLATADDDMLMYVCRR